MTDQSPREPEACTPPTSDSLPPSVRADVERILNAAARRLLDEQLDCDALGAPVTAPTPRERESWLDKRAIAAHLSCSVRSIEYAMDEGMPHAVIFGRPKFQAADVEAWLAQTGRLERRGGGDRGE